MPVLIGLECIASVQPPANTTIKMVFNERGAYFFPVSSQHRDMKVEGISYEDDYRGNALAAMVGGGKIEIRYHRDFSDRDVGRILGQLMADPSLIAVADWKITYQGRPVQVSAK